LKSKLGIVVIVFGWTIFFFYIAYDYYHYGDSLVDHFLSPDSPFEYFFHFIILSSLIGANITGYLINERKKLLVKTLKSERRLNYVLQEWRTTLDSMPYGVMLVDRDFNIIRANKYISDLSGILLNDLSKHKCYEIVHGNKVLIEKCPLKRSLVSKSSESVEFYDDVRDRYFISSVTPIFDENHEVIAYSHPLIDITELKTKELSLRKSKDAFFNMLRDVHAAHKELQNLYRELLIAFSIAIDAKSPWTKGHSERVTNYALAIAKEMGVDGKDIDILKTAGLLHDIGKIGTYDVILDKPSRLTDDEFSIVKTHPVKGEEILKPIKGLRKVLPIVRSHHERFDGKGYPDGLKADEIPLLARILFVADSFDSMTSDRPYRPSPGREYAISELKRCSGTQFDPRVVEAFLKVLDKDSSRASVEL